MLAQQQLLDRLIDLNRKTLDFYKVSLTVDDLDYGIPIPTDEVEACDTSIVLTAKTNKVVLGSSNVYYYKRASLSQKIPDHAELPVSNPESLEDVLDIINRLYGTSIDLEMVEDFLYDEAEGVVWISMRDDSLVWVGEITLTVVAIDLASVILVTQLDGLVFVD